MSNGNGERQPGFYWIEGNEGWKPWEWTPRGWTNDFVVSYYTDEEIGEVGPFIPYPSPSTSTAPADTDAAQSEITRLRRELEEARRTLGAASDEILSMYRTWVADDYEAMPPKNSLPGKAYYSARAALKEPTP